MTFDTVGTGKRMAFLQYVFLGGSSSFLVVRMLYHIRDTGEIEMKNLTLCLATSSSYFYNLLEFY